jgi:hypothetical protein
MTQDAVIIRGADGKFLPGTRAPNTIKSSEHARSLVQKRWDKARQASRAAVLSEIKSITTDVTKPVEAYAYIVGKQAVALVDSDRPRLDDTKTLGQLMGYVPLPHELEQAQMQGNTVQIGEADAVLVVLMRSSVGITNISTNDEQYIDADNVQEISTDADGDQTGEEGG